MGKNAQIHLWLETEILEKLKQSALQKGLSLSEFCRNKLCESEQLNRIELKLDKMLKHGSAN